MATLRNYGAALGQTLKDSAGGIVKGFGSGLKGAMLSEVPLLTAGFGAFSSLRKDANNMGSQQSTSAVGSGSGSGSGSPTNSSITGNPFAQMIQQLAQINANTAFSARADKASAQAEQYKQMFGEEEARERAQQNKALIDAIKNSGLGGSKGKTEEGNSESSVGGFFGGIIGNIGKLLLKGLRGLGAIIVAGFTAAMPFLRKMLTKVLSFALKRALFLIPGIGLILGTAALAYDVADMAGAFDGGDGGGNAGGGNAGGGKKGGGGLSMIDRARLSMGIPAGGTSPSGNNAKKDPKERQAPNSSSPRPLTAQQEGNKTSGLTWRVPVTVPYIVTSEFEEISAARDFRSHNGIDLEIREGEYIVEAAEGKLLAAGTNKLSGNFVSMDHGNGLVTSYCHLMDLSIANAILSSKDKEQIIKVGQPIGFCGKTGGDGTMRPHLHFMIRRAGTPVNPRIYIDFGPKNKKTSPDEKGAGLYGAPPAGDSSKASSTNAGANSSSVVAKRVTVPSLSSTPLSGEGGAGGAEAAYAAAGVNGPSQMTSAQVNAELNRAAGSGYYTQRENDANTQRVLKELGGIRDNTGKTFKEVNKSNRITMSGGKFKSPELLLREANKQFRDSLQKQLTRTISGSLMKALYPGGYKNVSQQTASGQMYRGEQLNKMLGLTPKLTKLGTSIFGKQYGPAFGQIFSKAATGYMEVGARSVAKGIFGSLGMNTDQANILGGQILGNLAKGTKAGKVTALEQIIYGMSGGKVALGAETIFAKYGFASPADGIGYMANVLGAGIMGPIDNALGTTPSSMANMDPRMRQMGAFGGYGGEYGGLPSNMPGGGSSLGNLNLGQAQRALAANPAFAYDDAGRLSVRAGSPESTEQTRLLTQQINLAKEREIQAKKDFSMDLKTSDERAELQRVISDSQYEQQVKTNEILSQRGTGSGSSAGGFFNQLLGVNAGDKGMMGAVAEVGNMALDFGKAALTQKVVQKLGIKNPYMQLLASAAVNKGLSIGGEYAFNAIKGTEAGSSIINYASTALTGVKTAFPSIFGTSAAPTAANIQAAGMEALGASSYAGGAAAAPAALAAETALAGTAAAGTAAAASGALTTSSTGIAADAFLTANMGGGVAAAGATPWLTAIPQIAVFLVAAKIATDVFFRLTSRKYKPKPVMSRIIRVLENNNINAKTFSNVEAGPDVPPKEWQAAADSLLNVGFNATKSAEVETKEKSPFEFIMVTIENDGIKFHADSGDPKNSKQFVGLGKLDNTFNSSTAASTIVKFVADIFKREYVAKSAQVDKAVTDLNKLTYAEIGNQLASSLKSKIDTSVSAGVFGTLEQDKILSDYRKNKQQAEQITYSGDAQTQDSYTPPQVYSQKEGKYVEAPSTMVDQIGFNSDTGESFTYKQKVYNTDVLMLDKNGNPIYDVDKSGDLNIADLVTPEKSTVSATVIASSAEVAGASATKGVTVNTVSDNSSTTTDQSQTINYTSMLSSARNPLTDTEVMAEIFS